MNAKESDRYEIRCPQCGGEAQWSFLDHEKTQIEILCPDCGRIHMPREDFDQVAIEHAELSEPNR